MSQTQSPLEEYRTEIESWIADDLGTNAIISKLSELGVDTTERSIRRARKRWELTPEEPKGPERARTHVRGDAAELVSAPSLELKSPEDLMIERKLDPKEWEVVSVTINEWQGPTKRGGGNKVTGKQTLKQLKIHLRRKIPIDLVAPARTNGPTYAAGYARKVDDEPIRYVLVGDQQAPFHDTELHRAFCDFLFDYEPDKGVLIGDTIDLPDISRHPSNPERDVTSQECIDAGYGILRDYREANEATYWKKLAGNHDERLRRIIADKIEKIYGLRRAAVPGEALETPLMDIGHLLRLDELGIEYVRPNGDYEHTQLKLSAHLAARHGWIARKGSGTSALATLEHLGFSVVVGHTHRQSLVHKTTHDIDGRPTTLAACETGCMCHIDGLGYAVAPDWQNGFATAEVWPDGTFKLDLATFVEGTLYYRDKRY